MTQVYQLSLIQNTLEKSQFAAGRGDHSLSTYSDGERISQVNGEAVSVGASTIVPQRIRDLSRGQRSQAPEVFQRKFDEYEYLLDVFKKQIESNFDIELIE